MRNLIATLFLLLASPSWATTYYVSHSGSDLSTGTTEAWAWRTLAYAEDQLVAGDTVYVKADSAYTDADGANGCVLYVEKIGTALLPITFEGYKATPGDGDDFADGSGRFEIDATGKTYGVSTAAVNFNAYRSFRNCYIHSASSHGVYLRYAAYLWCYNIDASINGGSGFYLRSSSSVIGCIGKNNGSTGIIGGTSLYVDNCYFSGNTGANGNIFALEPCTITNSIFVSLSGLDRVATIYRTSSLKNCLFYGSGTSAHGLRYYDVNSYNNNVIQNCIFVNCVKGIELYTGANNNTNYMSNNCFYNVATPYTNCASSGGDVLADPLFVDAANGDFHLRAGSPCIGAGVNGSDIGAYGFNGGGVLGLQATE